ncbi:MAG TPA: hypothetical protein VN969_10770 [Streptosporangiaceae bacterium]|nr:hypothetical protein [Streptosporangiaceae bacterium]
MEEEEARLALLQTELNSIQSAIRTLDTTILQIKGWCVTASLAIGGFAITYHKAGLVFVGEAAVIGFFIINCQFRAFQRGFMERNLDIDSELKKTGIMTVLKGNGKLDIVGTATRGRASHADEPFPERVRRVMPIIMYEVRRASNYSIYAFLGGCLLIEGVILFAQ